MEYRKKVTRPVGLLLAKNISAVLRFLQTKAVTYDREHVGKSRMILQSSSVFV